tara:strand:- start:843 stop:1880 length:1038 start_codon:yes stop_codon:yes gene_type:complete
MNFLYRNFTQLILIIFITILYFLVFEFITRVGLAITTKDKNFFYYGFNKDITFEIVDLTELKFNFENVNLNNEVDSEKKVESNSLERNNVLWAFGASLTHGIACGKDSSSWPNELQNLNNEIEVINFGFPSTFSNDSIKLLKFNLNNNLYNKPNYILWSHKEEEKLAIHRGLGNHKDKIEIKKSTFTQKTNSKFMLLRIEKTFQTNSISYSVIKHMIKKLQKRFNLYDQKVKNARTQNDLNIALENYKFNTIEAIELAKTFNIEKFIIVSLVTQDELEIKKNYFVTKFDELGEKLAEDPKVDFINVSSAMSQKQKDTYQKFYCANKHYTLFGNMEIAKILEENIF